ncbi:MAG: hypothetical protein PHE68_01240 [Candidatus Peribacteraceae bacterium]|nr:hypothetical protein [Candidatus Peribacteraceae bacterium]MDD5074620.1 hypothetical protein [Candidatus Peribacteraceae bacterium]
MTLRIFTTIGMRIRNVTQGQLVSKIREINARYAVRPHARKKYVSFALSVLLVYLLVLLGILAFRFLTLL